MAQTKRKWSQEVTETSHVLDLEKGTFTSSDPKKIAKTLHDAALKAKHHNVTPYQSAMSMLDFYINRAGKKLSPTQKDVLERAKGELRILFDRK